MSALLCDLPEVLLRPSDIELHVLCPKTARGAVVAAAYDLWHEIWLNTFQQLDGVTHLDSNEFSRQDEILCLVHEGECISVSALRCVDLSTRIARDDSYFRPWPREVLAKVADHVAISSNTAICQRWRRARVCGDACEPQRLSEAIIALAPRRFAESTAAEFVGVVRNDRKMDRVARSLGFRAIGRLNVHGIDSDIVQLSRAALTAFDPTIERIWRRRLQR